MRRRYDQDRTPPIANDLRRDAAENPPLDPLVPQAPDRDEIGAALVGISIDHAWCHAAFAQSRNLHFPLLADFHPKGDVAQTYGVYDDEIGMSERALFVIDEEGVIRWSHVSPIGVNPGADGILAALESMSAAPVPA